MTFLVLNVECNKSENPHAVIRAVCERATALKMMITCTTGKGVLVMATPGDDADRLIAQHDKQALGNRRIACISDQPLKGRYGT